MTEYGVKYSKEGHAGIITFGQSGEPGLGSELHQICSDINGDETIYAVIVNIPGNFSLPAVDLPHPVEKEQFFPGPAAAIAAIDRPTVAALNGNTTGAGLEMALACDMRLAVENARFGLPQITHGQIPSEGGTQRLARLIGKGKAMEMILTGESIEAAEALELGLVNTVVKAENLQAEVEALAATLISKAPLAMRYCKEAVNKGLDMTLEQGLRLEADLYFLLHTTADRTEGIRSFWQKRKPEYRGQ